MNVGEVMTQDVIAIGPTTTVPEAASLMLKEHVSGLPVVDDAHVLVGIVTEGDFLRRAETDTQRKRPRWLEFSRGSGDANEDMRLDVAVSVMEKHKIKRLPVVRNGRVVGILSRANLVRALAALPQSSAPTLNDRDLQAQLLSELRKHAWNARDGQIIVHNGVVDIWGFITSERQRAAIRVLAEAIPGVISVRDHLTLYEPMSGIVIGQAPDGYAPYPPLRRGDDP